MKVAIACEFSGRVRDAFIRRGHDAISIDLRPCESWLMPHFQGCVKDFDFSCYDLVIAHPPCTYLAVSGNRWRKEPGRAEKTKDALDFAMWIWNLPVCKLVLEQPVSILSSVLGPATQTIQPWMFGHGERKATCLWIRGLPKLVCTKIVPGRESVIHRMPPHPDRQKNRSRTYEGIAQAMADQWG